MPAAEIEKKTQAARDNGQMRAIFAELGDLFASVNDMYEDPTRYPIQELVKLFNLQQELMQMPTPEERAEGRKKFEALRDSIHLLPNAPERVYLWPEGKVPTRTEFKEDGPFRGRSRDYQPYMLEMLIPEDVQPVGAILLIAGGVHGAGTMNECYEIGLEFNALGYQCFILQCRPNGQWNSYDTGVDAARALRIVRANAEKYRVAPNHVALAGFSNGGITIDFCIEHYSGDRKVKDYYPDYEPDALDEFNGGPDAYLCVYGARHAGTPYDYEGVVYPPTFFAVGRLDIGLNNMHQLYADLLARGVPVEVHTFAGHPHGYAGWKIIDGIGNPDFDLWVHHADTFLRDLFRN